MSIASRILFTCCFMSLAIWELSLAGRTSRRTYVFEFAKMKSYMKPGDSPVNVLQAEVARYNRTLLVANVSLELMEDLCPEAMCSVEGFEKMGIEYGKSTINIPPTRCCDLVANGGQIYESIVAAGNFPPTCPFVKKRYDMLNFNLDTKLLPKYMPGADDWRFDVRVTCNTGDILYVGVWVTFNRSPRRTDPATPFDESNGPPDEYDAMDWEAFDDEE